MTTYRCYVDWAKNGTWVDEGPQLRAFTVRRGRRATVQGTRYAFVDTGVFEGTAVNGDQRYNAWNSSSALYGKILPRRPLRVQAEANGKAYNLLTGWLRDTRPQEQSFVARLRGTDGLDWLEKVAAAAGEIVENYPAGSAINDLAAGVGWPYLGGGAWVLGTSELGIDTYLGADVTESGTDEIPYWWPDTRYSVMRNIIDIQSAFAGDAYIDAAGAVRYRSRNIYRRPLFKLDETIILSDIDQNQPSDEIRNQALITAYPLAEQESSELWRLNDRPMIVAGGTITFSGQYQYQGRACAASEVTTPAATTDYTANAEKDGSGADKTGAIDIIMTTYANQARLEITNNDAGTVYLTMLKIRGKALANLAGTIAADGNSASQDDYETQSLTIASPWMQLANEAQNHATFAVSMFSEPRRRLMVRVMGLPDVQFTPDLFDMVRFENSKLSIPETDYMITYIEHEFELKQGCITTWRLEPMVEYAWVLGKHELGVDTKLGW